MADAEQGRPAADHAAGRLLDGLTVRQDLLKLGDTGASDFKDNSLDRQHEAIAMPREFVQTNADLLT